MGQKSESERRRSVSQLLRRCCRSARHRCIVMVAMPVSVGLLAGGCGSSGSSNSSTSSSVATGASSTQSTASVPVSTSTTISKSSGKWIQFTLTTSDGWQYSGSVPLPTATASATKDISSSPPGQAKVGVSLTSTPVLETRQFSDTNPGRPNGPQLKVDPGTFVFPMPAKAVSDFGTSMLDDSGYASLGNYDLGGGCSLQPPYGGGQYWWPGGADAIYCSDTTGSGEAQYSASESLVDQFVADLHGLQPIYVVDWDPNGFSGCNIAIFQSEDIQYAPDYSQKCSAKVTISVAGSPSGNSGASGNTGGQ